MNRRILSAGYPDADGPRRLKAQPLHRSVSRRIVSSLCMLTMLLLMAACSTSRKATTAPKEEAGSGYVAQLISNAPAQPALSAKMKFVLNVNGKELSVGGKLRMKRDDVIQLSLVGFGIVEAGVMEFTQDKVLIIDRIHKQYVNCDYDLVPFLSENQLDFYTLQALFANELILAGEQHVQADQAARFALKKEEQQMVITPVKEGRLNYTFYGSADDAMLQRTVIGSDKRALTWSYGDFTSLGNSSFPQLMEITFSGLKKPANCTIRLSNLSSDDSWKTRTTVRKGYTEVTPEEILKRIGSH